MKRDISALANTIFDVVIIGGGVYGAACALDAVQRGLNVALIERGDFGAATSSNSAKIGHSGIRYLQHLDVGRMRHSILERHLLTQNAPHLVDSQPVLFPLYGHGLKGREVMSLYVRIYDALSPSRRRFQDPRRRIAGSRVISRNATLAIAPHLDPVRLTGAAIWQEGQIHNTERLLAALLHGAAQGGAQLCNYAEATALDVGSEPITVDVADREGSDRVRVRGRIVLNTAGPWIDDVLRRTGRELPRRVAGSKAFSLITRSLCETHVLSFTARGMYRDKKAIADKGGNIQFAIPWRGHSLIGSLHLPAPDDPTGVGISDEEIETYIAMINEGYPAANLKRSDVKRVLWGMIPGEEPRSAAPRKDASIVDHADDGMPRLVSVSGVKFTTSRGVAEQAINLVCRKLDMERPSRSAVTPVWGGDIPYLDEFEESGLAELSFLPAHVGKHLLRTYGTRFRDVLKLADGRPELLSTIPGSDVLGVQILFAVREEMALRLSDAVLRRTDLGSLEFPGEAALRACADIMAPELGWDGRRIDEEVQQVSTQSGYCRSDV